MSQPTPSELALLHNRDKRTELYLSIYQPKVVFVAQINDPDISIGEIYIDYDTASSGTYASIKSGMTMYIGSTPGGTNYGRIRVRSADDTTITVAENSDINWKDDLYLTIKDFYEVWPVYQTLQQAGNTPAEDVILVFKDRDIEYAGQNDSPGSLIWMGSHRAAWLEGGHAQLYWSASGTVNTNDDAMTYAWTFEGGTSTGTTLQTPGMVDYDTAGHYVTQLDVTSSSGTVDTSYRYVSIYDDAHQPINEWGMDDLKGSRSEGAYTTNIWIRQPVNGVVEGALVVIFSKNYYGSIPYSFTNNIEFVGYILNDSISYDYQQSKVEFSVGSVTEVMKGCEGPGVSLTSSIITPTSWSEMKDVSISKAIWFFLRWHSTVLSLADVQYLGADYLIYSFETDNGTLYEVLSTFLQTTVFGSLVANRQGQMICEVDPSVVHSAPTAISLGMAIDRQDWMGEPNIREATRPEVSYLEMGGYAYEPTATTGANTPYLACAPGVVPSYFGKMEDHQGLALHSGIATSNQAFLNTLAGDYLAYRNARFPETQISMAGNYGNIELVPSERYLLTVEATDSQNRMVISNLPVHPVELTWKFVSEKEFLSVDATFHELTEGISGTTLQIPENTIDNVIYIPPYEPPPWIPITGVIPWIPPIIPPGPPPNTNCMNQDFPTGPYQLYPDITILDIDHREAYCWFPCQIKETWNLQYRTRLTVYLSSVPAGATLDRAEALTIGKGVFNYAPFHFGKDYTIQITDDFYYNGYRASTVAGFRIKLEFVGDPTIGYQQLSITNMGNVDDITLYPTHATVAYSSGGTKWCTLKTPWTMPIGSWIEHGNRFGTGSGAVSWGNFYVRLEGGAWTFVSGDYTMWPLYPPVSFDEIYCEFYNPMTSASPEIVVGGPTMYGSVQLHSVFVENVCPVP